MIGVITARRCDRSTPWLPRRGGGVVRVVWGEAAGVGPHHQAATWRLHGGHSQNRDFRKAYTRGRSLRRDNDPAGERAASRAARPRIICVGLPMGVCQPGIVHAQGSGRCVEGCHFTKPPGCHWAREKRLGASHTLPPFFSACSPASAPLKASCSAPPLPSGTRSSTNGRPASCPSAGILSVARRGCAKATSAS